MLKEARTAPYERLVKLLFVNIHKLVLYADNADTTLVLYDIILPFVNIHKHVLYADNALATLVL